MNLEFQKHLKRNFPELQKSSLGIAISGGIDSVVLAHLCLKLGIKITLLHCNFKLRGEASDKDQAFVECLAKQWGVSFLSAQFDTQKYVTKNKISIQLAARELRYTWFQEMAIHNKLDAVATAHHADDSLETFLINLSRGTGLEGLMGIPEINTLYCRPLLIFSKQEILNYAQKNNLKWREDASNAEVKYLRNKIRHEVVPKLKEIQPHLLSHFNTTIAHLKQSNAVIKTYVESFKNKHLKFDNNLNGFKISIAALEEEAHSDLILFEILKTYGFSAWEDIVALLKAQSGKQKVSKTHVLLKDRDYLFLYAKNEIVQTSISVTESEGVVHISASKKLIFINSKEIEKPSKYLIYLDLNKLKFPLVVRKWKEGDYFYPFGMSGKKKISKYFKDEKFSILQKEKTRLLCSENNILWIIGHRTDKRFIAAKDTANILKIAYQDI